jgi:hypothetical protein
MCKPSTSLNRVLRAETTGPLAGESPRSDRLVTEAADAARGTRCSSRAHRCTLEASSATCQSGLVHGARLCHNSRISRSLPFEIPVLVPYATNLPPPPCDEVLRGFSPRQGAPQGLVGICCWCGTCHRPPVLLGRDRSCAGGRRSDCSRDYDAGRCWQQNSCPFLW